MTMQEYPGIDRRKSERTEEIIRVVIAAVRDGVHFMQEELHREHHALIAELMASWRASYKRKSSIFRSSQALGKMLDQLLPFTGNMNSLRFFWRMAIS